MKSRDQEQRSLLLDIVQETRCMTRMNVHNDKQLKRTNLSARLLRL
jgi:predicted 2-oxoglutarate/Fe(II)-dependent dioxygenase YbiX